ncbi:MAG TPA: response regulator [Candidatus Aminicenantes bacterium]|nr:response regulator [Candidatus Aminicenantes bacterium]
MSRILLVDDSILMRRNLKAMVETYTSHEVVGEAVNGREALLKYRELLPDLVTMDVNMPAIDGIQAIQMIRSEFPTAVIVAVSTVNEREKILAAIDAGAANYLLKPIDCAHFVTVIDGLLAPSSPGPKAPG